MVKKMSGKEKRKMDSSINEPENSTRHLSNSYYYYIILQVKSEESII